MAGVISHALKNFSKQLVYKKHLWMGASELMLKLQKQPFADVLQKRFRYCNFIEKTLLNRRFPVNLQDF